MLEKLSIAENSIQHWKRQYDNAIALNEKNEKIAREKEAFLEGNISMLKDQNKTLLEIIRWMTNKETTNYPFRIEKNQFNPNETFRNGY